MKIDELKKSLNRDLKSLGYVLYDVSFDKGNNILQILIDKKMDLKEIEDLSKKLSKIMDLYDEEFDQYILDVSSVGLERPIRSKEELNKAIDSYIYVKTKELKINAYLREFDGETLKLEKLDKNIKKNAEIKYDDIKQIHYAVDFKGEL